MAKCPTCNIGYLQRVPPVIVVHSPVFYFLNTGYIKVTMCYHNGQLIYNTCMIDQMCSNALSVGYESMRIMIHQAANTKTQQR